MTIGDGGIHVDFAGTSPASAFGINVVLNYTLAYTAFGVKCLVAPEVPNNAGSLAPITVEAPDGCLLNAKRPRAVAARHTVGHMLPDVVFGCLHQVIEGGVPAEGASSLWIPQIYGGADVLDELGAQEGRVPPEVRPFSTAIFHCGGTGARPGKDGLDVTAFPCGVRTIPVEATEAVAPVLFRRREFREGSGGAGQVPRRSRPDHRTGRRRRHADRDAVQFRAHRQPGARPRRRRQRAHRAGSRWFPASRSAPKAGRACRAAISSGSNCRAAADLATRPRAIPSRWRSMSPTG